MRPPPGCRPMRKQTWVSINNGLGNGNQGVIDLCWSPEQQVRNKAKLPKGSWQERMREKKEKGGKGRQANGLRIISIGSILSNRNSTRSTTSRGEYYAKAGKEAHAEPTQSPRSLWHPTSNTSYTLNHLDFPAALRLTLPPVPHAQPKPQLIRFLPLSQSGNPG